MTKEELDKFMEDNKDLFDDLALMEEMEKKSIEVFPVKLRECGDGRDENWQKRQCFRAGAMWAVSKYLGDK